ncbi:nuclear transport factor 2 family protein [Streptomyces sp. NPDC058701]|uniref:nuclear transport factor 2 family protein n=1 Tax=Streptomyces sp. NPDC058701 TaxID=3346608 RepID=UPI00365276E5
MTRAPTRSPAGGPRRSPAGEPARHPAGAPARDLAAEVDRLSVRLLAVTDRLELRELFERYVIALDTVCERDHDDDWFRTVFTEDVRLDFPIGTRRGVAGFAGFLREARGWWERTHHISATTGITLDGDRATVRVHQLAAHVHRDGAHPAAPFDVGGYYDARAVRTPAGWRFDRLAFRVVWSRGQRLASMAGAEF